MRIAFLQYARGNFINAYLNGGGSTLPVGVPIIVSDRVGIPSVDILPGGSGPVEMHGQYSVPLKTGDTPAVGDYVYYDAAAGEMTTTVINDLRPVMVVTGHNVLAGEVVVDLSMLGPMTPTP